MKYMKINRLNSNEFLNDLKAQLGDRYSISMIKDIDFYELDSIYKMRNTISKKRKRGCRFYIIDKTLRANWDMYVDSLYGYFKYVSETNDDKIHLIAIPKDFMSKTVKKIITSHIKDDDNKIMVGIYTWDSMIIFSKEEFLGGNR